MCGQTIHSLVQGEACRQQRSAKLVYSFDDEGLRDTFIHTYYTM